jgi:polyhydroxyalkanoate synthesis regulator phasin
MEKDNLNEMLLDLNYYLYEKRIEVMDEYVKRDLWNTEDGTSRFPEQTDLLRKLIQEIQEAWSTTDDLICLMDETYKSESLKKDTVKKHQNDINEAHHDTLLTHESVIESHQKRILKLEQRIAQLEAPI